MPLEVLTSLTSGSDPSNVSTGAFVSSIKMCTWSAFFGGGKGKDFEVIKGYKLQIPQGMKQKYSALAFEETCTAWLPVIPFNEMMDCH